MSWTALTSAHLASQLSARELELLREGHLETGQADPVEEVVARVTAEVRDYIPALRADHSLAEGLLPGSLHGAALDIARWQLCTRLAASAQAAAMLLTEPRKLAWEAALAKLKLVAEGVIGVEPPPAEGEEEPPDQDSGHYGSTPYEDWP